MGINDRDYIRQRPGERSPRVSSSRSGRNPNPRQLLVSVGQMLLTFVLVALSLRLPVPLVIKLLIAGVLLVVGTRWILRSYPKG